MCNIPILSFLRVEEAHPQSHAMRTFLSCDQSPSSSTYQHHVIATNCHQPLPTIICCNGLLELDQPPPLQVLGQWSTTLVITTNRCHVTTYQQLTKAIVANQ